VGVIEAASRASSGGLCRKAVGALVPSQAMSEQRVAAWPIVVFTDGAAKGNPGPGGWGAVVVTPDGQVTELGGRADHSTNNRMELTGAINGLAECEGVPGPVAVYTDSTYVIQGIRQWIWGWRSRGWRTSTGTEVLNRDLWERLSTLVDARGKGGIAWHYVRGHIGTPGNERVDEIADGLAQRRDITLYRGPLSGYPLPILELPEDTDVPARRPGSSSSGAGKAAHSYLSVVDGTAMRHATWAECERRVKGRSGARFKKAMSASEEAAILRGWNIDPRNL
jgi:ribonuclease HI